MQEEITLQDGTLTKDLLLLIEYAMELRFGPNSKDPEVIAEITMIDEQIARITDVK